MSFPADVPAPERSMSAAFAAEPDLSAAFAADPVATYRRVRAATLGLVEGLSAEDLGIQSMPDASPAKWHLAHTAWFFETFVLRRLVSGYRALDDRYLTLFNSYYVGVGAAHQRSARGVLSRPGVDDILSFRAHVDDAIEAALRHASSAMLEIVELGLHHEQQHQELILTDLAHGLSCNPIAPVYRPPAPAPAASPAPLRWIGDEGGLVEIGHDGRGFAFDNEGPRHTVYLRPFAIASRPSTARELLAFVDDGGYQRPELWMSLGWDCVRAHGWDAPATWHFDGESWTQFGLGGRVPLDLDAPAVHLSWFEADAFARWSDARLPTEAEWEHVARDAPVAGNFVETGALAPRAASPRDGVAQLFGDVWEWTGSAYVPYPGYRAPEGALGEYNGKFMCNQYVLRGGSCASPASHLRASYRNFFPPDARWQFSGVRLARDP